MVSFLHEMFLRFGGAFKSWNGEQELHRPSCSGSLIQAVEHVVDETHSRLRFLPGYTRRLQDPVATAFGYIDELVEELPEPILCSRSTFAEDPRVNAFFVDPRHLQKVFSENAGVHELFDRDPSVNECWALLCMRKEEHQQLGMSLVGDLVQRDVMQTLVNFTDHQIYSPAATEAEARCSLKCCIFNSLLAHIRRRASDEKIRIVELENRRQSLLSRSHRATPDNGGESAQELQRQIDDIGRELAGEIPRLASPEYHLDLVTDVLGNPARYVAGSLYSIRLSRLGIRLADGSDDTGNEIALFEIRVASQGTRVGVLVHFPRAELLPRQSFVQRADFFLSV
jgi:hypothetical protein